MAFKMDLRKFTLSGVLLLLTLDVIYCYVPGVGIRDVLGGPLNLQCQSKNDNIGAHTLQNGQVLSWRFHPDVYGSTLFWCSFNWEGNTQSFSVWDIHVAPIYDASINDWDVRPDGFFLYDPVKFVWVKYYNWNPANAAEDSANLELESKFVQESVSNGL